MITIINNCRKFNSKRKSLLRCYQLKGIYSQKYCKSSGNTSQSFNMKESKNALPAKGIDYIHLRGNWPTIEKQKFLRDMVMVPDFITELEEEELMKEIDPYMRRLHYEFDHWDDAIHGFRETERKHWYPGNRTILNRVQNLAFEGEIMPYVHILDLDSKGVIKPHVDSARYCGCTIAGMSLLTDSVMRLVRTDENRYKQSSDTLSSNVDKNDYRDKPEVTLVDNFYADLFLKRRSLYIMSHSARYNYTHEVLSNDVSEFKGKPVLKTRRVSIICRNEAQ